MLVPEGYGQHDSYIFYDSLGTYLRKNTYISSKDRGELETFEKRNSA